MNEEFLPEKINPLDIDRDLNMIEMLFNYTGELGAIYDKKSTEFKIWAPIAQEVKLILYNWKSSVYELKMKKEIEGVWSLKVKGNLNGIHYTYKVKNSGIEKETTDPYCRNISKDGSKSIVIDMKKTNPKHWHDVKNLKSSKNNIIYEISIRDFTSNENSKVERKYRGKYKGLSINKSLIDSYGINYLEFLGVTHVQLMPIYDFSSGEDKLEYNWGYNPKNYNIPEQSYAIGDSEISKIIELKELIMNFHNKGIKVVMDVVYNHHTDAQNSNFNKIVPKYYFRKNKQGEFSNGSGCGNEFATERKMVKKFIIDSMIYWAKEYKIDGFRLDLMGLYDIETIKDIRFELDKINKDILLYGEPWKGGESSLNDSDSMIKDNMWKLRKARIACFNDDFRDCTKGSVFDFENRGFISGKEGMEEELKHCIVGSIKHKDIDYSKLQGIKFLNESYQTINYDSCHDNNTLFDKLVLSNMGRGQEDIIKMNLLEAAILLTSQGNCFISSGEEFLRTKRNENGALEDNSYKSGDYVNSIDWSRREKYYRVVDFYKNLISIRKKHKVFNLGNAREINNNIRFIKEENFSSEGNLVAYIIDASEVKDSYNKVLVAFNGSSVNKEITLDEGNWDIILDGESVKEEGVDYVEGNVIRVKAISALIAVKYK